MNLEPLKDIRDREIEPFKNAVPRYGMGYEYHDWLCPTCGSFLAYEPDIENIPKRCGNCGQFLKKPKDN